MGGRAAYVVHLPSFAGPIEDLVQRAHQGEVDLREVSVGDIVRGYLEAIRDGIDLDEATEFLRHAAQLVEMKSKLLLPPKPESEPVPQPEEEGDLAASLEAQMEEYRTFKEAAAALAELEAVQRAIFTRPAADVRPGDLPLVGVTVFDLFAAFRRVLERSRDVVTEIPAEGVTVAECMRRILRALASAADGLAFDGLFGQGTPRIVVIVTFLALLELIRRRRVGVRQDGPLAPILLYPVGSPDDGREGRHKEDGR
ncbi:MAG: segregation/condensation protein A [Armatimonadota bacterium]|nr:segregation/condensation protein A [Armatimonadota bacterium]MDR5697217.1 segregation/condensation protein A [Armatimonadota bacterium]